ncbi:hypothetical protein Tco_1435845, partial [Tanacetum coccineum]
RRRKKADVAGKINVVGGHCSDQPYGQPYNRQLGKVTDMPGFMDLAGWSMEFEESEVYLSCHNVALFTTLAQRKILTLQS